MKGTEGFSYYHENNISFLQKIIGTISTSEVFYSNIERMSVFLNGIDTALETAVYDAEIIFRNLNGKLKKLTNPNS